MDPSTCHELGERTFQSSSTVRWLVNLLMANCEIAKIKGAKKKSSKLVDSNIQESSIRSPNLHRVSEISKSLLFQLKTIIKLSSFTNYIIILQCSVCVCVCVGAWVGIGIKKVMNENSLNSFPCTLYMFSTPDKSTMCQVPRHSL